MQNYKTSWLQKGEYERKPSILDTCTIIMILVSQLQSPLKTKSAKGKGMHAFALH